MVGTQQLSPSSHEDFATRDQVMDLIVEDGPITAATLASRLHLTPAGIRRHLVAMEHSGKIETYEQPVSDRGRGRPSKYYVAATAAHDDLPSGSAELALQALSYLRESLGEEAVQTFAARRGREFVERYRGLVNLAGDSIEKRAEALATAMAADGFAATARPVAGTLTLQLCQGHCPVYEVAEVFPVLCAMETKAIGEVLGVHVQRLATLAGGEHVCTTNVPVSRPTPDVRPSHVEGR